MELKAGDKVLVTARYSRYINEVEKITPAGNIRLKNGALYTSEGKQKTKDVWNVSHIQPLTLELEESFQRDALIRMTLHIMHETSSITYEQAVKIQQILENQESK